MQRVRTWKRPEPIPDVLEEYVEESAWLYRARQRCTSDPELSWEDLQDREARLDAHLHGLSLAGRAAADLLRGSLCLGPDDDHEVSFVAGAVYPCLNLVEPMEWLVEAIAAEPPNAPALLDGLRYCRDDRLEPWIGDFLAHESPAVRAAGIDLATHRGAGRHREALTRLREDADPRVAVAAIKGTPDIDVAGVAGRLQQIVREEQGDVAGDAALLLLEARSFGTISLLRERLVDVTPELAPRLLPLLAVVGGPEDSRRISDLASGRRELAESRLLAIGLSGNLELYGTLVDCLDTPEDESCYTAAYQALRILTGIDALPEFDLEDADAEALSAYRSVWTAWLGERAGSASSVKWRRGRPVSPAVLIEDLLRSGNPCRFETYLELKLRYGCPLPFEPTERFDVQAQQLRQLHDWALDATPRFEAGALYLGGEPAAV